MEDWVASPFIWPGDWALGVDFRLQHVRVQLEPALALK